MPLSSSRSRGAPLLTAERALGRACFTFFLLQLLLLLPLREVWGGSEAPLLLAGTRGENGAGQGE